MNCCCPAASRYTFPLAEETGSEYALARVVAGPEDVRQRPLAKYSDVIEYAVKTLYAVGDLLFKKISILEPGLDLLQCVQHSSSHIDRWLEGDLCQYSGRSSLVRAEGESALVLHY